MWAVVVDLVGGIVQCAGQLPRQFRAQLRTVVVQINPPLTAPVAGLLTVDRDTHRSDVARGAPEVSCPRVAADVFPIVHGQRAGRCRYRGKHSGCQVFGCVAAGDGQQCTRFVTVLERLEMNYGRYICSGCNGSAMSRQVVVMGAL